MANNFFRFKQFTVEQEHCAMKVCTDACLFGAWIASVTRQTTSPVHKILDIGSGTGLLSLMTAQQNPNAVIDAIEIDPDAARQSQQNFQDSPWNDRLNSIQADVKEKVFPAKYDLIISNPPFFENDLKSDAAKRNLALHSDALSLEELLTVIKSNLADTGRFAVLLPYQRSAAFEEMAIGEKFYPEERVLVKQTPKHPYFRSMLLFSTQQSGIIEKEIVIKDEFNDYSKAFIQLLKSYYLFL